MQNRARETACGRRWIADHPVEYFKRMGVVCAPVAPTPRRTSPCSGGAHGVSWLACPTTALRLSGGA